VVLAAHVPSCPATQRLTKFSASGGPRRLLLECASSTRTQYSHGRRAMSRLKPHHYELLQRIITAGELPVEELDGRLTRPLRASGLVRVEEDRVRATEAGKKALSTTSADSVDPREPGKLSSAQEDLLRRIVRNDSIRDEEADLRTVRALCSRGLVRESQGMLTATPAGTAHIHSLRSSDPRRRRRPHTHPRAEAILKAVEQLEYAIPPGAEVLVGPIMCAADDVTEGFRALARRLIAEAKSREP
jgi:hypothetical protein